MTRVLQIAAAKVTRLSPQNARARLDSLARLAPPGLGVTRRRARVGGVPGEWIVPRGWRDGLTFLHFHGGGYALCSALTHRLMVSDIARATGARGLAVEHRLAPEHPYPAAIEDCVAAYRGVLGQGVPWRKLFLTGDSAGAALAIEVMVRAREDGLPLPLAAVLMSPWADLECRGATMESNAPYDYLSAGVVRSFAGFYLAGHDPHDRRVSPVHADLTGLPRTLIQAGGAEVFLADIVRLKEKAESDGVDVTFQCWDGMVHAFQGFTLFLPEARAAMAAIGDFVRTVGAEDATARLGGGGETEGRTPSAAPPLPLPPPLRPRDP
jgi:acetyl esterase/lipase